MLFFFYLLVRDMHEKRYIFKFIFPELAKIILSIFYEKNYESLTFSNTYLLSLENYISDVKISRFCNCYYSGYDKTTI
jgi:hypothetical protein